MPQSSSVFSPGLTQEVSPAASTPAGEPMAGHLLPVPGGQWSFWKWICLRSAGFPAQIPLSLAAEECAAAADAVFQREKQAEEKRKETAEVMRKSLEVSTGDPERKQLARALRQINKGNFSGLADEPWKTECAGLSHALSQRESAVAHFKQQFQAGVLRTSQQIRSIAGDPRFRQAVLLQNREALRRVTRLFQNQSGEQLKRGFKERQNEEMIVSYLQRYCLKNDTIGSFGPVGWATLEPTAQHIQVLPGPTLIASSSIYFENWCIEALAESMAADTAMRPWLPPRLLPFYHVKNNRLHGPSGTPTALAPAQASLLGKCRGDLTAREIAREMMMLPEGGITSESEVFKLLTVFAARGVIAWKPEIALCLAPENELRALLERIDDEALRQKHLQTLNELEHGRQRVARAVWDAGLLEQALEELDESFIRITGRAATKSAGAMYAARTLTYQDCRRDLNVKFGAPAIAALGGPLSLLLASARWFSYRTAAIYRDAFHKIYEHLSRESGSTEVDLLAVWAKIEPLIFDPENRLVNDVGKEMQSRWEEVLQIGSANGPVQYSSGELRAKVESVFAAPHAGWHLARYHSPDVMIAASSVEAIARGDYSFVLGEIHITTNTVRFSFAFSQHPRPEELMQAIQSDLSEPHVIPVSPRQWPRVTNRTALALVSPLAFYLEVASDTVANAPRSQTLPISSLVLTNKHGGLVVQTRDGSRRFDPIELIGEILSGISVEMMKISVPRRHQPRVTIDRLVVNRESWSFAAADLRFIHIEEQDQRYLEVRRWMREQELPRFVFVRVSVEVKPFYVDFDCTVNVEIFVKLVRRILASNHANKTVTIAEMLPAPDQLWLPDSHGNVYACELRMVARDMAEVPNPVSPGNGFAQESQSVSGMFSPGSHPDGPLSRQATTE
jgi:hypothetical protein